MLNSTRTKYYSAINRIITAREQSCAKVMVSVVSFCNSVCPQEEGSQGE